MFLIVSYVSIQKKKSISEQFLQGRPSWSGSWTCWMGTGVPWSGSTQLPMKDWIFYSSDFLSRNRTVTTILSSKLLIKEVLPLINKWQYNSHSWSNTPRTFNFFKKKGQQFCNVDDLSLKMLLAQFHHLIFSWTHSHWKIE